MNKLLNKNTVSKVAKLLHNIDPNLSIITLESTARSAEEAAQTLHVETGAIIKSLVFKSINNDYYLCLISGDKTVSTDKLSKITNSEIIKPNAHEIKRITGYSIGGVPPIAHKIMIPTYIDSSLSRFNEIFAAAGHPYCIFKINYKKICEITKGKVCDIIN